MTPPEGKHSPLPHLSELPFAFNNQELINCRTIAYLTDEEKEYVMKALYLHAKLVEALEACTDFLHGQYLKDIEALLKEAKK